MSIQMNAADIHIEYCKENHILTVQTLNRTWTTAAGGGSVQYEENGTLHTLSLNHARQVEVQASSDGIGQTIDVLWRDFPFDAALSIKTRWRLEEDGLLTASLLPFRKSAGKIRKVLFPAPFVFDRPQEDNYTIFPLMQGALIPNGYPQDFDISWRWEMETEHVYTRSAYMPWWGQIDERRGYQALVLTPFDAGFLLEHPSGGSTKVQACWLPSLGHFDKTRHICFRFYEDCDYVTFCKAYRKHLIETGRLRTLQEKQLQNPLLTRLMGSAIIHTSAEYAVYPGCRFYSNPDVLGECHATFAQRENQLVRLKELGLENAYVHLDGWIKMGYDAQHPDVWPPCEKAGGLEGLLSLQRSLGNLGWLFALHDQYRDYYLDAPSYQPAFAIKKSDGSIPTSDYWAGGEQAFLCPTLSQTFIKRNYERMAKDGIHPDGVYLDVFSCVALDECFDPEHPITREECMRLREECFEYMRSRGIIVSSEEGVGWAMYSLDLVHHANYAMVMLPAPDTLCGIPTGEGFGINVPLLNLVYHDCVVTPWFITPQSSEMPKGQSGFLHALLNAGVPYVDIEADKEEIEQAKIVCALHKRLAGAEMLRHEILDGNTMRQRTVFSDGTQITVDFSTNEYAIITPDDKDN